MPKAVSSPSFIDFSRPKPYVKEENSNKKRSWVSFYFKADKEEDIPTNQTLTVLSKDMGDLFASSFKSAFFTQNYKLNSSNEPIVHFTTRITLCVNKKEQEQFESFFKLAGFECSIAPVVFQNLNK